MSFQWTLDSDLFMVDLQQKHVECRRGRLQVPFNPRSNLVSVIGLHHQSASLLSRAAVYTLALDSIPGSATSELARSQSAW